MDPRLDVEYLSYLNRRLGEFEARFREFMSLHHENTGVGIGRGLVPAVSPAADADPARIAGLTADLNRLSGNLMDLAEVTGLHLNVSGYGLVDPFTAWESITRPKPVLEASDVAGMCANAAGRLEAMLARATSLAAPLLDPARLHPRVWSAAERLWHDGHTREAVRVAAETVSLNMRQITGRGDTDDTALWQQAFSDKLPEPGKPRLRWPGDPEDLDVRNMNAGLRAFAPGVNMVVRNAATHLTDTGAGIVARPPADALADEQEALERLAVLSLLARLVDRCDISSTPEPTSP